MTIDNDPQWTAPILTNSPGAPPQPGAGAPVPIPSANARAAATPQANATADGTARRKKRRWWLLVPVAALTAVAVALGLWFFRSASPTPFSSGRDEGYTGTGTLTGTASSAWTSGIDTAWTLSDFVSSDALDSPALLVEGTTLYVAAKTPSERHPHVAAFDVSGSTPRPLWDSTDTAIKVSSRNTSLDLVAAGDKIIYSDVSVDKTTGAISAAPWIGEVPVAAVEDILVTCSGFETCTGWTWASDAWEQQWKSITSLQDRDSDLEFPNKTRLVGNGDETSLVLSIADEHNPQLINIRNGVVTTFGVSDPTQRFETDGFFIASDGYINIRNHRTADVYDLSGQLIDTFEFDKSYAMPTSDGPVPSLAELTTYLKDGKATWALGTVQMTGRDCTSVTLILSSDVVPHSAYGATGVSLGSGEPCFFTPLDVRASTDASVVFLVKGSAGAERYVYFMDTVDKKAHTSSVLSGAFRLAWAFDDLLIATTDRGIVAFTPKSA